MKIIVKNVEKVISFKNKTRLIMAEQIHLTTYFSASHEHVFTAWMDESIHAEMLGTTAEIDHHIGGNFSIWEGYITGTTVDMFPFEHIIQNWRTTDFPQGAEDSVLEIFFREKNGGTELEIKHSNIPDGQGKDYESGWEQHYFAPMRAYFEKYGL